MRLKDFALGVWNLDHEQKEHHRKINIYFVWFGVLRNIFDVMSGDR